MKIQLIYKMKRVKKKTPESESVMRFSVLFMSEMTTLIGKSNKVRESHTTIKNMVERCERISFDVLFTVIIQTFLDGILDVIE